MSKMSAARNNVSEFPIFGTNEDDPAVRPVKVAPKPSWIYRFCVWYGVIMPNPDHPRGWTFNPAVITLTILIAGLLTGAGYYVGEKNTESRHLLERLQKAEEDARVARELSVAQSGQLGHTPPTPTPQEKKPNAAR